jgi:hypothetical protein
VRKPAALALVAACFLTVGVARWPLLIVMPLAIVLGVAFARRDWL